MARPSRILDPALAASLRAYMQAHKRSATDIAGVIGVDKATISRSLKNGAFSTKTRGKVSALVASTAQPRSTEYLLQKSLQILQLSDKLRADAERMIAEALDQSASAK